jgi:hypothetical protein
MAVLPRRLSLALLAGTVSLASGCAPDAVAPSSTSIAALVTGVTARSGQVTALLSDAPPPPASSGPIAHVPPSATVSHAHGSRVRISVSAAAAFNRVYISSPAASGCWDLLLPAGATLEDLDLTVSPAVRSGRLKVRYTLEGPTGVGGATEQTLEIGS